VGREICCVREDARTPDQAEPVEIALFWPRVYGHDRVRWSPARAKRAGEVSVSEPP
jgi:hypothetical protein